MSAERGEMTGKGSQAAALPVAMELGPVRLAAQTASAQDEKFASRKASSGDGCRVKLRSKSLHISCALLHYPDSFVLLLLPFFLPCSSCPVLFCVGVKGNKLEPTHPRRLNHRVILKVLPYAGQVDYRGDIRRA
jgi:hypothetical protein